MAQEQTAIRERQKTRLKRIAVAAAPLLASMLVMLLIVTYIPEVSLFLTRFM